MERPPTAAITGLALRGERPARYFPGDGTVDALAGVSVDFYALALPVI